MNRAVVRAATALAVALAVGCNDPVSPAQPVYVTLAPATFSGAGVAPRAVNFRFVGRQLGFAAVIPGSRVFTSLSVGDTVTVAVIAPFGQVLSGSIVKVMVPSTALAVSADSVRLLQVAAIDYSLLSPAFYSLQLQALLAK